MNEEDLEANIEWGQAKSFSNNTRISRRLDQKKALVADSSSKNNFKKNSKTIKKIAPNLKKIQSKIRDIYDEEDAYNILVKLHDVESIIIRGC